MSHFKAGRWFGIALVLTFSVCVAPIWADVVVIAPSQDNTLYEDLAGAVSNGAGASIFAGQTGSGAIRRGLIQFDIAGHVPAGATIDSARLTLHMSQSPTVINEPIELHSVLTGWGEGTSKATTGGGGSGVAATPRDATWLHTFYDTERWSHAGGDISESASAVTAVGGVGDYVWTSTSMAVDAQHWLDAPDTNHGWLLLGNASPTSSVKRFDSREGATPPSLSIGYSVVPEPSSPVMLASAATVLAAIRRTVTRRGESR